MAALLSRPTGGAGQHSGSYRQAEHIGNGTLCPYLFKGKAHAPNSSRPGTGHSRYTVAAGAILVPLVFQNIAGLAVERLTDGIQGGKAEGLYFTGL